MQENKGKLIILGVLIIALAVTGLTLSRKASQKGKPIAGTSFTLLTSFYDLKTPLGVAVDGNDNVYVSNTGNSEVIVYDSDGNLLYRINKFTDDQGQDMQLYSPYGLAVDDVNNKLYICDYSVRVLDKYGKYLYSLAPPEGVVVNPPGQAAARPNEVALYNNKVYVTSRDGVFIFDNQGKYLDHWGTRGDAMGQFDFPNGIAVDPNNGNVYVVDTNNWRLEALTADGKPRWAIGNWADAGIGSPFHLPRSVAISPNGLLYVSDIPDRILVFDLDGNLKSIIGERGTEDTQINFPEGMTVSSSNKLYVADRENNRVQIWQLVDELPTPGNADVEKFKKATRRFDTPAGASTTTTGVTTPAAH